jgi:hypothetical protein
MDTSGLIHYLDVQVDAVQALIRELDEVQVRFNARFDEFKASHDAKLDELTEKTVRDMAALDASLRATIEEQLPGERQQIDERRQKVRETYLPQRQQAASQILEKGQLQVAGLRKLNPELDAQEEGFKAEKAQLEARLAELNETIRKKSRGLGVVPHFVSIFQADRERQRILGKLDVINNELLRVRRKWESQRKRVERSQAELQEKWQLESIAVARLQAELDQLDDDDQREDLALRRAIRGVLDDLKEPAPASDPDLDAGLQEMIKLNVQTDDYHAGLASVGGMIGLLRGIKSGMGAIRKSIEGLQSEGKMHSAYLKPLDFSLPVPVEAFNKQWGELAQRFADDAIIGEHPTDFCTNVEPLLDGPLSQASIEKMFNDLGAMIQQATARW